MTVQHVDSAISESWRNEKVSQDSLSPFHNHRVATMGPSKKELPPCEWKDG